ncbi:uncharacterized protein LOC141608142 [Silene latifolia]|uniref:uncharacterized protein LOC141608142 n=1 Tax=Silene latifolia TaxID=37657 RepID=UPI003D770FB3
MWGEDKNFVQLITNAWQTDIAGHKMYTIVRKLKLIKPVLKQLNKDSYSDIEDMCNEAERRLEKVQQDLIGNMGDKDLMNQEYEANQQVQFLQKAKFSFLQQQAKAAWLCEGDGNTALFHRVIKTRRAKNAMFQIEDRHGSECTDQKSIQEAFLEYYGSLLGMSHGTMKVSSRVIKTGRICDQAHWNILMEPVTNSEIKESIFSPQMINLLGQMVSLLLKQLNATNITLIPKIDRPTNVLQFRLLSAAMFCTRASPRFYAIDYQRTLKFATENYPFKFHRKCAQIKLCHLMFADDLLLFCKGDKLSIMTMIRAFGTFSQTSGLKLSPGKSSAYFNGMKQNDKDEILAVSGFREGELPFKYLGVPIQTTRLSKHECMSLIEKLGARIRSIGAKKLSYAGRLVLVQSVLATYHNYWAMIFVIPKGVLDRIDSLCRNFLWEGGAEYTRPPMVSWDKVCTPKKEGGLGLRNLTTWNMAAVGKLAWWVTNRPDKLWVQWVHHIYLKGANWGEYNPTMDSSWSWRKICQVRDKMNQAFTSEDCNNEYSIRQGYNILRETKPVISWFHQVWASWSVPKHRMIAWLIYQNALNTRSKLYRLGVSDRNTCCICEHEPETIQHLFFECAYSDKILSDLEFCLGIKIHRTNTLHWLINCRGTRLKKRIIRVMMNAYLYFIWHRRNISRLEMTLEKPQNVALSIWKLVQERCIPLIKRPVGPKDRM